MFRTAALVLFFFVSLSARCHDFYLSITQMEYNTKTKSLEIAMKLTAHDLEYVLEKSGAPKLNLGSEKLEASGADTYVETYLKRHFEVVVNGATTTYVFLGKEVELDDDIWLYVEIKNVSDIVSIDVKNSMLSDYFEKQQNHIHLKLNGDTHSCVLMNGKFRKNLYNKQKDKK